MSGANGCRRPTFGDCGDAKEYRAPHYAIVAGKAFDSPPAKVRAKFENKLAFWFAFTLQAAH
jgi:hypothetical protein